MVLLEKWLKDNRYTDRLFSNEINKVLAAWGMSERISWRSIGQWRRGVAVPRPLAISAIKHFTKEAVTASDHVQAKLERDGKALP